MVSGSGPPGAAGIRVGRLRQGTGGRRPPPQRINVDYPLPVDHPATPLVVRTVRGEGNGPECAGWRGDAEKQTFRQPAFVGPVGTTAWRADGVQRVTDCPATGVREFMSLHADQFGRRRS